MSERITRRSFLRRSSQLVLGAGLGLTLAQACGPAAPGSQTSASQPASKGPVTLTYWDFITPGDNTPRGQALAANLKNFEAENPDIKVKVEVLPPAQIYPQAVQAAAAKKTADVIRVYIQFLEGHVNAGTIDPLDSYLGGWDKSDWLVDWNASVFKGKKMGVPYEHRVLLLLYRKKLLEERGIAVPKTWDEVLAGAKKIGPDNPMGVAVGLSKSDNANVLTEFFAGGVVGAGGKLFNDDGTVAFNSEAGARTFRLIDDFYKQKATSQAAVNYTYDSVTDGLKSGTIAMGFLGSHRIAAIQAGAKGDLGFARLPGWQAGKPGPSLPSGFYLSLGKYSSYKEQAVKFIDFMTGPKAAVELSKGGEVPPRKSSYKDPFFSTPVAADALRYKEILESDPRWVQYPEKWLEAEDMLADAAQQMVLQNRSPKEVLDGVAKKYNALIGK